MEISILRVAGSSVPALGGLQVWGQPCIRCSQDEVNKIYKQWSRILRRGPDSFLNPQVQTTDSSVSVMQFLHSSISKNQIKIRIIKLIVYN